MPCRSSRAWATACSRRVASGSRSGSSDHRPVTVGGPVRVGISGLPYRREPIRPDLPPPRSPPYDGPARPGPPEISALAREGAAGAVRDQGSPATRGDRTGERRCACSLARSGVSVSPGYRAGFRSRACPGFPPCGGSGRGPLVHRTAGAKDGAQRRQRVVGEPPSPDQVPDRRRHSGVGQASPVMVGQHPGHPVGQHPEEQAAAARQHLEHGIVHRRHRDLDGRREQQGSGGRGREHHPAVAARQPARAGPDDLPGRRQLVEHRGLVAGNPARQDQRLQRGGGHGRAGELIDHVIDRVRARRPPPPA